METTARPSPMILGSRLTLTSQLLMQHQWRAQQEQARAMQERECHLYGGRILGIVNEEERAQVSRPPPAPPPRAAAQPTVAACLPKNLVYLRRPPREEELIGNRQGRRLLAELVRQAHRRAGRAVGQSMILVMGPSGCGKSHCVSIELQKRYSVVSQSSLDFSSRSGNGRRRLDEFLREQAASHNADGKPLAIVLEEADELFAACPQALDVVCGAVVVATMSHLCFDGEEKAYYMFRKLRNAAEAAHRLVRFHRPNKEECSRALLRRNPTMAEATQNKILAEACGDFRQLAIVEELFRMRHGLPQGATSLEQVLTPFEQAKEVLLHGRMPVNLEDANYACGLVVHHFHGCCRDDQADLEAMAAMAEQACAADVRVTAAYRGNDSHYLVTPVSTSANEISFMHAALHRPRPLSAAHDMSKLPDMTTRLLDRLDPHATMSVVMAAAIPGAVELPSGTLPLSLFRGAKKPQAPCVYLIHNDSAQPLHKVSWLGGLLYDGVETNVAHYFPVPGRTYQQGDYALDEDGNVIEATLQHNIDYPTLSAVLGMEVSPDPRLARSHRRGSSQSAQIFE